MSEPLTADVHLDAEIVRTPRVLQVESMFDIPPSQRAELHTTVTLPVHEKPWQIGLIVGPSGAGKTTAARALFGDRLRADWPWPDDRSIVDAFPAEMATRDIIALLNGVGFSSPPAWLRPFRTLSTGEQFRVQCARAIAESDGLVAVDEWTSVVDRQVAQVASHAVAKVVRRQGRQLVAIGCHYDVLDWLQPDWVYQPHLAEFSWRSVQSRPPLELRIGPLDRSAWRVFRQHHYLSGQLLTSAKCFGAWVPDGRCVAFAAVRHFPHPRARNIIMSHRRVVLPDWQGIGIGSAISEWIGQYLWERGWRLRCSIAHPAVIMFSSRSPRWRDVTPSSKARGLQSSARAQTSLARVQADSRRVGLRSFEYVPPAGSRLLPGADRRPLPF